MIILILKKRDRKQCTNYKETSLLSLPGKVHAKCREIVESNLEYGQFGFRPGRSIAEQSFALNQVFAKSWECGKDLFACFVNFETAYYQVPRDKLWSFAEVWR